MPTSSALRRPQSLSTGTISAGHGARCASISTRSMKPPGAQPARPSRSSSHAPIRPRNGPEPRRAMPSSPTPPSGNRGAWEPGTATISALLVDLSRQDLRFRAKSKEHQQLEPWQYPRREPSSLCRVSCRISRLLGAGVRSLGGCIAWSWSQSCGQESPVEQRGPGFHEELRGESMPHIHHGTSSYGPICEISAPQNNRSHSQPAKEDNFTTRFAGIDSSTHEIFSAVGTN